MTHELSGRVLVGSHLDASAHAGVMVNQRFKLTADSTADAPLTWKLEACSFGSFGPFDLQALSSEIRQRRSLLDRHIRCPHEPSGRARLPNPWGRLVRVRGGFLYKLGVVSYTIRILMYPACILHVS
jgi:hypothetical protein